jgi:Leucine-rich repeat (LRR) protein
MRNNRIRVIPSDIGRLTQLKVLVLSGNQIQRLPEKLFELPLVEVYLAHNQFTELPSRIHHWTSVSLLDISHNQLTQVPQSLESLPKLRKLNLSHNDLSELPLTQHASLEELELHHNQLKKWTAVSFPVVKRIDLRYNKLNRLESDPINLGSLKELHLGFNQLNKLISFLKASIHSLELLDIRDNQFESVPLPILDSKTLKRLDLTNNNISFLPPELGWVTSLDMLIFHGNPVRGLSGGSTAKILKILRDRIPKPGICSMHDS